MQSSAAPVATPPPPGSGLARGHLSYRPDIDGLRAIAVLSVFAFHLGVFPIRGGFVGVDIFFVISGYLIGRSIHEEIGAGQFSLVRFYERRFRRILPALFVVLAASTAAGVWLLFPLPLIDYAWSMLAAALSYANVFFWATTGYFAGDAESKPLLHTWSLGVEEQYYLLFPLLLWAVERWFRQGLVPAVALVGLASFVWAAIGAFVAPTTTFYLLPTRFWELLIGFGVSLTRVRALEERRWREAVGLLGLASIAIAVVATLSRFPFPGLTALPPCLGAALLILVGSHGPSTTTRLLSVRPLVFVGLISYSFYLWHWPLIVFARQALLVPVDSPNQKLAMFLLTLGLATVSWRLVERPFRTPGRVTRRAIFGGALAAAVVSAVLALGLVATGGLPGRFSPTVNRYAAFLRYPAEADYRAGSCFLVSGEALDTFRPDECLTIDPDRPNVLLLGDSHAAHLFHGLNERFPGIRLLQANVSGCKAVDRPMPTDFGACAPLRRIIFDQWLPRQRLDLVILSARWWFNDLDALSATLDHLAARGVPVLLVGPVPEWGRPLAQLLAEGARRGDPAFPQRFLLRDRADLDARFRDLAREHHVAYVSPYRRLCGMETCRTVAANGAPVQFDGSHLTREGSVIVAGAFDRVLGSLGERGNRSAMAQGEAAAP